MKTDAIERLLDDAPGCNFVDNGMKDFWDVLSAARTELDALTRLARLVQAEDGSDGVLVQKANDGIEWATGNIPDESSEENKAWNRGYIVAMNDILAEARRAMEEAK